MTNTTPRVSPIVFKPNKKASYKKSELCVTINDKVSVYLNNQSSSNLIANVNGKLEYGTVKFIGSVQGKTPLICYYGIELETNNNNTLNGRNDGKYNNIEYFRCGAKKGIFVRRNKIKNVEYPHINIPRITVGNIVFIKGKYKCKGIIKYIGLPLFKRLQGGFWFGIELKQNIGKNNGIINNIKYFESKHNHGIFVKNKLISICRETHNKNDKNQAHNHGIIIHNIQSDSLKLLRTRTRSRTVGDNNYKKNKKKSKKNVINNNSANFDDILKDASLNQINENDNNNIDNDNKTDNVNDNDNDHKDDNKSNSDNTQTCTISMNEVYIIKDYGYPITFLLSDKKADIFILKEQIINLFGHIELIETKQISIKNVDKMCLLVRINFHSLQSYEKAKKWKFWWKKKCVSMKKHSFKKYRQLIKVETIYPIGFYYKKSLNLSKDDIKKFLIEYCNNLEELLQNKYQIQFIDNNNNNEYIKCVINFVNIKARKQLFDSKYISLKHIVNQANLNTINQKDLKCQFHIDVESIAL